MLAINPFCFVLFCLQFVLQMWKFISMEPSEVAAFLFDFYLDVDAADGQSQRRRSTDMDDAIDDTDVGSSEDLRLEHLNTGAWLRLTIAAMQDVIAREHGMRHLSMLHSSSIFEHMDHAHNSMKIRGMQNSMKAAQEAAATATATATAEAAAAEALTHSRPPLFIITDFDELDMSNATSPSAQHEAGAVVGADLSKGDFCRFAREYPCLLDPLLHMQVTMSRCYRYNPYCFFLCAYLC